MKNTSRKGFRHLTQKDRDRMEALVDQGETQVEIAKILKVDQSSVSREWQRKRKNGWYDADTAQHKAGVKRGHSKYQGMKVNESPDLKAYIIAGLSEKRSPDEIAGRMKREKLPFYASKNAIYKWLYSVYGQQYAPLLCSKRYHKKRQKKLGKRTMIPNRKGIENRPLGATNKTRYGHYEGDTIVAPKKAGNTVSIAIVVERKTKLIMATKMPSLAPHEMTKAINGFAEKASILSITMDNGIENKDHENWMMPAYTADPYSPWQKPLVECTIGLARKWYFKKGTNWMMISEEDFQTAILMLNNKYRKSLGYRSALEVEAAHGSMKKTNEIKV